MDFAVFNTGSIPLGSIFEKQPQRFFWGCF